MTALLRVRAVGTGWTGGPGLMTQYFSGSTTPTAAEALEAAARVRACVNSLSARIPTGISWQVDGNVDVIEDSTGALVGALSNTPPAVVNGTSVSARTSTATAVVIRFSTAAVINGRRLRGRTYWSPVTTADVASDGGLNSSAVGVYSAAFGLLVVQITTPITHRVWHRPGPLGGGSSSASTGNTIVTKLGVLRSRRD